MLSAVDLSKLAKRKRPQKAGKGQTKKLKRDNSTDDESDDSEALAVIKKCKDDGDVSYYEQRIGNYLTTHVDDATPDFSFDGGLKVPHKLWQALYKYQKTGVKWLWELHCQQVGGILGDEMGLGKTIQVVVFLAALHHSRLVDKMPPRFRGLGPTIIVTPVTVMHQWVKEFHKWYPPIRVAILHATGSSSSNPSKLLHSLVAAQGVVLTSYSTFLNHQDFILKHQWQYIILDEGHKIRNPEAQVTVAVKRLKTVHRIILSGSPIQNNLKELWSLYDFVFPGKLGMLTDFMEHFAVPITQGGYANASQTQVLTAYKCACVLRESISPYLIRRMKADVNDKQLKLPSKSEQVLFCRLSEEQRAVYQEYLGSSEVENIMKGRLLVFPGLIKMLKICNHPDLTTGELRTKYSSGKISAKQQEYGYYKRSGKLVVCKSLLEMWYKQGRKVLLFTQSSQMLNILEKFIQQQEYGYLRMDGSTAIGSRQVLVNKFNQDKKIFVFLLTTRVGGLGVNLVGASRIIIYDPDWNPSTDIQARERAWRIGQSRDVIIYRLICTGSIEEKVYQRQIFKQFLTNKILSNPKQRRFFRSGDMKDLFSLAVDENSKQDSETHAIFASTGSRIDLKKMQEKADAARKLAKQKAAEKEAADRERRKSMWEMAKKLSQKMEEAKAARDADKEAETQPTNLDKEPGQVDDADQSAGEDMTLTDKESKDISSALATETRNIINTDLFNNLGDLDFESKMEDKIEDSVVKKKQPKSAKCEGKKIPGLAKVRKYRSAQERASASNKSRLPTTGEVEDEEYILGRLLKKSLVNGAMKHDTIVDACNADYAIIEAEATEVAKQAAEHLRRSQKRMKEGIKGHAKRRFGLQSIKTSTTSSSAHAQSSHPSPPHAGPSTQHSAKSVTLPGSSAKPSALAQLSPQPTTSALTASPRSLVVTKPHTITSNGRRAKLKPKRKAETGNQRFKCLPNSKVFSGASIAFGRMDCVQPDMDVPLPSSVLLKAMRLRNGLSEEMCDKDHAQLSEDIREFIAMKRNSVNGRHYVTTQEIVDEFPQASGLTRAAFRAILMELCSVDKVNGVGRWTLRPEFS